MSQQALSSPTLLHDRNTSSLRGQPAVACRFIRRFPLISVVLLLALGTGCQTDPPAHIPRIVPHPAATANIHAPGEVDIEALVPFIVPHPALLPGIVLDETEATLVGEWQYSTHTPPYVGIGYLHDQNTDKGSKAVIYPITVPSSGEYEVRLSHCYNIRRSTMTLVTIKHADGIAQSRINQQATPEHERLFRTIGIFPFRPGHEQWIRISNDGTDGYVIADAIQLIKIPD